MRKYFQHKICALKFVIVASDQLFLFSKLLVLAYLHALLIHTIRLNREPPFSHNQSIVYVVYNITFFYKV